MTPIVDPQEYYAFYFSDLLHLVRSSKKRALLFGSLFALVFLASLGAFPPLYKAEALFKESFDKNKTVSSFIENLLPSGMDFSKEELQAITLMKSKQILKRVVERLGLQVQREEGVLSRYQRNWRLYFRPVPNRFLEDREEAFSFSGVSFLLESKEKYFLQFDSLKSFLVFNCKGRQVGAGSVGEEVCLGSFRFTLESIPKKISLHKKYSIVLVPWLDAVRQILKNISLAADKNNASFVRLTLSHPNRNAAISILNQIMKEYESYLKEESEKVVQEQIAYLEKRHEDLSSRLEKTLGKQVDYLEKNLGAKGFVDLQNETKSYLSLQQRYLEKLSDLDCKINLLQEKGESILGEETVHFSQKIEELKRQRDPLDLALNKKRDSPPLVLQTMEPGKEGASLRNSLAEEKPFQRKEAIDNKTSHLKDLRKKKEETLFVLQELKKETPRIDGTIEFAELKKLLESWRADGRGVRKEDLQGLLSHLYHLLSVEEMTIQENPFSSPKLDECSSLDLEGARNLFQEYSAALENSRCKQAEYIRIQKEFLDPHFEISSLASIFEDSVTQGLIKEASLLSLRLCDEKNYAPKERERFREEILVRKSFLSHHIQELVQKELLQSLMLEEKLQFLQGIILDRLNQEISILDQQRKEFVGQKIESLQEEKKQLLARLERLKEEMSDLPKKWKKEKELKFETNIGLKVVEKLCESIENKTLLLHLQNAGARAIDPAIAFSQPKAVPFMSSLIVSILLGVFVAYLSSLLQGMMRGFPVTQERWRDWGFVVLGRISNLCEELPLSRLAERDLELLRKMVVFLGKNQQAKELCPTISILANLGPNYAHSLAHLLTKSGRSVLLIDTSFDESGRCGFMHYLSCEIKECPIEHHANFDLLVSGKEYPHGAEVLGSRGFCAMIACLKEKYDAILLFNKSSLKNMEPQVLLPLSDFLLLTYEKETLPELKPFTDWANFDKKSRLMLIEKKSED